jgi:hypothetical protein
LKRSSGPRTPTKLPESVHRQLNMYALAAGAAGVSMLALPQPAESKIVYTPAHVKVAPQSRYGIHFDLGALPIIYLGRSLQEGFSRVFASASPNLGGVAVTRNQTWALPMVAGAKIGPARLFRANSYEPCMASLYILTGSWKGPWANGGKGVKNRYLGVRFKTGGKFHYGWARVTVTTLDHRFSSVLLTGYAYETIPNKAIIAGATKDTDDVPERPDATLTTPTPEPATLGALALGAPGLSIWRRKESSDAAAI